MEVADLDGGPDEGNFYAYPDRLVGLTLQQGMNLLDALGALLPATTLDFLRSEEAVPIINRIRAEENVRHY
jgi:hypothetical protein